MIWQGDLRRMPWRLERRKTIFQMAAILADRENRLVESLAGGFKSSSPEVEDGWALPRKAPTNGWFPRGWLMPGMLRFHSLGLFFAARSGAIIYDREDVPESN